ncbi:MAG: flagellar protein FhlB [Methylococcales bacterium]|jgi:flagellar biosynthesis protein|nr:flagellar protein FhlB [Methylococcales bacterium]MBT7409647.1 flagellar protein FhlB [Methylococcales bacterium]
MSGRIVNSPEIAIALKYDGDSAPHVVAKGKNHTAEKLFKHALDHNIPLHEDPEIAQILTFVPVGAEIPENLYRAIAEIIAFSYLLSGKTPDDFKKPETSETPLTEE